MAWPCRLPLPHGWYNAFDPHPSTPKPCSPTHPAPQRSRAHSNGTPPGSGFWPGPAACLCLTAGTPPSAPILSPCSTSQRPLSTMRLPAANSTHPQSRTAEVRCYLAPPAVRPCIFPCSDARGLFPVLLSWVCYWEHPLPAVISPLMSCPHWCHAPDAAGPSGALSPGEGCVSCAVPFLVLCCAGRGKGAGTPAAESGPGVLSSSISYFAQRQQLQYCFQY